VQHASRGLTMLAQVIRPEIGEGAESAFGHGRSSCCDRPA
jgi:hypothetical protein